MDLDGDSRGKSDGLFRVSFVAGCRLARRYQKRRLALDGPSTFRASPAR
jgi:hypothetical protein